jgi:hypothetical protein
VLELQSVLVLAAVLVHAPSFQAMESFRGAVSSCNALVLLAGNLGFSKVLAE